MYLSTEPQGERERERTPPFALQPWLQGRGRNSSQLRCFCMKPLHLVDKHLVRESKAFAAGTPADLELVCQLAK